MGGLLHDETFTPQVFTGKRWVWLHSPPYPAPGHGGIVSTTDRRLAAQVPDVSCVPHCARRWARGQGLELVTYRCWARLPWREWLVVEETTVPVG